MVRVFYLYTFRKKTKEIISLIRSNRQYCIIKLNKFYIGLAEIKQ